MIPILEMSEADHDQKIDQPHNPPENGLSEEEFDGEYYRLYDEIEMLLARHGENDAFGQGDYYLEPHIAGSRGLGLEITNPEMITPDLLVELSDLVRRVDPRWEVYLGSGNCDFGIFVSASEARIWRSEDSNLCWQR